ncbi:MAG: hypothetical protein CL908_23970 [Deltaproteobacteria bacterium]|nr:hypothetical protein [Deltaproteobacteria bacterium]
MRRAIPALVWILLACAPSAGPPDDAGTLSLASSQGSQAECLPSFPDRNGWYGGDAAFSLPLAIGDGRTSLWLFGDSFVERAEAPGGRAYPFVHNTVGLSHCDSDGRWQLETFWRRGKGKPHAFFEPDPEASWARPVLGVSRTPAYYWPSDAFMAHGMLFVGLLRVAPGEPRGPFRLPFRLLGVDLARIENPRAKPPDWRIRLSTLSEDRIAFPGSAFVITRRFLYAFAFYDRGDDRAPRMLSRLPLDALTAWQPDLSPRLETWTAGSGWKPGFLPDEAAILMDDDASEMSVHFDLERGQWLAVYSDPTPEPSRVSPNEPRPPGEPAELTPASVRLRRADRLEGPWSAPAPLVQIPELSPHAQGRIDENLFCYAGKAHPQFAERSQLLVTYVCNLFARSEEETILILRRLAESPELYRPRALSVGIPAAHSSPAWPRSK